VRTATASAGDDASRGSAGGGTAEALMGRLRDACRRSAALQRCWDGDTAGLADQSRSGLAFALGAALKREGFSYPEVCALLRRNSHTAAWVAEKGEAAGGRELDRIWERAAEEEQGAAAPWPAPDPALATADTQAPPLWPTSVFPHRWQGWIHRAAERAGSPPDYVGCSLLAVVGAAIGNARWGSPWEGWAHPPVVNVACIGTPATGKSPGIDAAAVPLADLAAASTPTGRSGSGSTGRRRRRRRSAAPPGRRT
jgi:hypothetical protein